METFVNGIVERYFANFLKYHDLDYRRTEQERDKLNRQKWNLISRLEHCTSRAPYDLANVLGIVSQILILSHYIRDAFGAAIIMVGAIYYFVRSADAKRFTNEELNSKKRYLNARTSLELYHDGTHIDEHISRIEAVHYELAISWKTYQHNLILQRVGVDFAVLGFILYCVVCSMLYTTNQEIVWLMCANFLKNIPRIRDLSKFYFGLYIDFTTYEETCKGLLIEKVPQISSFNEIVLPSQTVKTTDVSLEIPDQVRIPGKGVMLVTGPSGAGKTTFLDILSGMRTAPITSIIDGSTLPISSVRGSCNVYNHSIEEVKSVTPEQLISSFGKFNIDVKECASIAAIPSKLDLSKRTGGSTSKGEFQRISVAEMVARLMSNKDKQLTIWDELTDGIDDATALGLVNNIIKQFASDRLVVIVTHNSYVRERITPTCVIDVTNLTVTQIQ